MKIKNICLAALTLAALSAVLIPEEISCCTQTVYLSKPLEHLTRLQAGQYCVEINHNARTVQIAGNLSDPIMERIVAIYSRIILTPVLCPENNFSVTVKPTNQFTPRDVWSFPTDMESLTFHANYLGDIGAMRLAQGLPGFSNLESLNLSRNNIGDAGALFIACALPSSVRNLDLSNNQISSPTEQRIQNLIRQKSPDCIVAF